MSCDIRFAFTLISKQIYATIIRCPLLQKHEMRNQTTMDGTRKKVILITGFGPFGKHTINASWEAVKELKILCTDSEKLHGVQVITEEIPVVYKYVDDSIPTLWKEHEVIFAMHVGVSAKAECLVLEQQAHSTGYVRKDMNHAVPEEQNVISHVLHTKLDIKQVCRVVNESTEKSNCKAVISYNAGRYLCEYTFYRSLCFDPNKTLFVHVPDFDKYTSKQTAKGLFDILCYILEYCNCS